MTMPSTVRKNGPYSTNGVTTDFAYDFRIDSDDELEVYKITTATGLETLLTLDSDYTVSGAGDPNGGDVVITPVLAAGYQLVIRGTTPVSQDTDFTNQGPFHPDTHEDAFDKLTKVVNELTELVGRCLKENVAIESVSTLGPVSGEAMYILRAADGGFSETSVLDSSTVAVSTDHALVLDGGVLKVTVDGLTIGFDGNGFLEVVDDAITTAKILDANVTKAKIENLADYTVLGNVSGAAAAPAEVAVLDEDDLVSDSATSLASQQSIKAYVDAEVAAVEANAATWQNAGSSNQALVIATTWTTKSFSGKVPAAGVHLLTIKINNSSLSRFILFREDGDTDITWPTTPANGMGASGGWVEATTGGIIIQVRSDSAVAVEFYSDVAGSFDYELISAVPLTEFTP